MNEVLDINIELWDDLLPAIFHELKNQTAACKFILPRNFGAKQPEAFACAHTHICTHTYMHTHANWEVVDTPIGKTN